MRSAKRRQAEQKWEPNDFIDVLALPVAAVYCDVVITERNGYIGCDKATSTNETTPFCSTTPLTFSTCWSMPQRPKVKHAHGFGAVLGLRGPLPRLRRSGQPRNRY